MSTINGGNPISNSVEIFKEARDQANQAWEQTMANGEESDLQTVHMRAVICGLEATSLLLQRLIESAPTSPTVRHLTGARPNIQNVSKLLTSSEAATEVGVSLATIRRWANDGHVRVSRTPGNQRRFDPADLQDIMHRE